jgi:hypothetical protein
MALVNKNQTAVLTVTANENDVKNLETVLKDRIESLKIAMTSSHDLVEEKNIDAYIELLLENTSDSNKRFNIKNIKFVKAGKHEAFVKDIDESGKFSYSVILAKRNGTDYEIFECSLNMNFGLRSRSFWEWLGCTDASKIAVIRNSNEKAVKAFLIIKIAEMLQNESKNMICIKYE